MILPLFVAASSYLEAAPPPAQVLRLSDAERMAVEHQPTVRQARAQTGIAEARVTQTRAPMLPQVTAIASYQRVRSSGFSGTRGGATTTTTGGGGTTTPTTGTTPTNTGTTTALGTTSASGIDIFTVGASANQVLWDFGQTWEKYRAAEHIAMSAEAQQKVAEQTVLQDVRRAYFAARAQKALVSVAEENLANVQRHLDQIQGFVQVGTRPEIDLAQARTDVANARVQLISAQNNYLVAKAQVARAVGDATGNISFEVADDELAPVDGEDLAPEQLSPQAMRTRPELAALERQREGQELTVKGLRGGYGPTLSATGGYQQVGTSPSDLNPAWNVGVSLVWPVFQGGLTHGQVREAEANLDVTRAQLDAQKLQIGIDVQQAALTLRAAKATETATRDVVTNAKERLRLAEGRYAQGVGSAIELGDAQVAMTQASAQLVQARFNVSAARADLLAALGRR